VLPIRDDNPTRRFAVVTFVIIALNAVAFLAWEPTFATGPNANQRQFVFFYCQAEVPYETTHQTTLADGGASARGAIAASGILRGTGVSPSGFQSFLRSRCPHKNWFASIFTAMFLHAGWAHIGFNMLFLWIFGNNVEDRIGRIRYLLFYLAAGIVASLAQLATGPDSAIPNLGASGAIAGVLGAYLVMFPRRKVLTVVILFFFITWVYVPAVFVLGAWFLLQLLNEYGALSNATNASGGVAFAAHIGGFVFGVLLALLFFPKEGLRRPPPRRPDVPRAWGVRRRPALGAP